MGVSFLCSMALVGLIRRPAPKDTGE